MKYIEVGYICNDSVKYRNDFKAIKIGKDRVLFCEYYAKQLKDTLCSDKLHMCIYLYNQAMFDLSQEINMNHATYNLFKYEKKIKQIERKKKRNDKQKALLLFWNDADSKPINK